MRRAMTWILMALLVAGSASSETITVNDDATGGNSYGNTQGFAIDFDATTPAAAASVTTGWAPALVAGKSYALNSISIQYGGSVTVGSSTVYLGVYSTGLGTGFLGVSKNAIDFSTLTTDQWATFEFEDINVTVDSTVGSGSGLLYFRYQSGTTDGTGFGEISTRRLNYDAPMAQGLASIIAYGTVQGARAPEYIADIGNKDTAVMPHDPMVLPENEDGSVGTLLGNYKDVDVTLTFKAAMNEDETLPVNPNILGHYIYMTSGVATDPNLYPLEFVEHTDMNDPNVAYGPTSLLNAQGKSYKWKVEEILDSGLVTNFPETGGTGYVPGDPNNIMGNDWSFRAVGAIPPVSGPDHVIADASGNASLVVTSAGANNFRWYKVVGQKDTVENGEVNDTLLSNGGIYSGTQTNTLVITSGTLLNGAEAQYYCIAYNGDPTLSGTPSASTVVAWLWIPRLVSHYSFETTTIVDGNSITPDSVSGYNLTLASNDVGLDIPVLEASIPSAPGIAGNVKSLKFNNPRGTDPNVADAQFAGAPDGWLGGYKDITISMWVYSSGGSNWNRIFDFGNSQTNNMFICVNPGSVNRALRFAVNVNGTEQSVTTAAEALPDNEWTHVTAVLSGNTGRIYVNGERTAENTSLSHNPVSFGPITQSWLGRSQFGANDGYFNGMIDELKIYNYALSTIGVGKNYLADTQTEYVCNRETYDMASLDFNENCKVDLGDFATIADRWLEDDRIYINTME